MFARSRSTATRWALRVSFLVTATLVAVTGASAPVLTPEPADAGGTLDGSTANCGSFEVSFLGLIGIASIPEPGWVYVDPTQKFQSVSGLVTKSKVTHTDFPPVHDSHDQNTDIEVDPQYIGLVATGNSGTKIEMEWEIGTFPNETGSDPERTFPKWAWPSLGDRAWTNGAHIFDCGHPVDIGGVDHFKSEIHPARAIAAMRQQVRTMPGTGTTPVPVTATDLYIHGHSGFAPDDLECGQGIIVGTGSCGVVPYPHRGFPIDEDFEFDIQAPPKPVPSAVLATFVEDGPGNNLAPAPILTPNPDGVSMHVEIPLAGSGATPADVYARKIYIGWVYPSEGLRHLKLTLNKMDLHNDEDTDPGDCECSFFWFNVNTASNEWIRMSTYATGNMNNYDDDGGLLGDGEMGFSGAVFDFYVSGDQPFRVQADGYDQDCLDERFGEYVIGFDVGGVLFPNFNALALLDCYINPVRILANTHGDNTLYDQFEANFGAPDYGVGSQDIGNGAGDYELEFTIEEIALAEEDAAELSLTKLCQPTTTQLADVQIQCTVLVENTGPGLPRNVVLKDTLLTDVSPSRYTVDSASFVFAGAGGGPNACEPLVSIPGGQQVTCNLGTVPIGGTAVMTLLFTSQDGGNFDNVALVTTDSTDSNLANNQDEDEVTVLAVADLEVNKTTFGAVTNVAAGTNFTYLLTVENHGPSGAVNVTVEDLLPAGVAIVSVGALGGTCNAGVPGNPALPTTCNFTTIPPGGVRIMAVAVHVLPDTLGLIFNDAEVSGATLDINAFNNLDTYPVTVFAQADVSIAKTSDAETYKPNTLITFKVAVTNNGPSTARNVVVVDMLPPDDKVTYLGDTGGCVVAAPKVLSCGVGILAPGETREFFVYVEAKGKLEITNQASVSTTALDPVMANNTASKTVSVTSKP